MGFFSKLSSSRNGEEYVCLYVFDGAGNNCDEAQNAIYFDGFNTAVDTLLLFVQNLS